MWRFIYDTIINKKNKKNFAKSFYFRKKFLSLLYQNNKPQKTNIMKRSDLFIIVIGVIVIAAIFAAITYIAFTVNAANAGFHGGF